MKKKFEILMVACLFISAFLLARASAALTSSRHAASSKTCIVLDAGHGGSDPGKVGCNDTLEKDINLSIVLKLKTLFENKGYKVVLTRSDDTVPADENSRSVKVEDLRNRVKLITDTNPVMTISIHQNSFPDASVSGPQVFYFEQSAESSAIASVMQDTLNNSLNPPKPRVCKSNNDYYILKKTPTPIIIVEPALPPVLRCAAHQTRRHPTRARDPQRSMGCRARRGRSSRPRSRFAPKSALRLPPW